MIDQEIEDKTTLTVLAKPVSREAFILGKYVGVFGAILAAHYLAGMAFFMAMRHGVLETAADTSDPTVLVLGPGVAVIVAIAAGVLNYLRDSRFLPTLVSLLIPALTLSTLILFVIDRDFSIRKYEVLQPISSLPPGITSNEPFRGIVTFRPDPGNDILPGHSGNLVRRGWQGPINDEDRQYLLDLVNDLDWQKTVRYLVKETRELSGWEVLRAGILIVPAIALLAAIAVAASTRLGVFPTFLTCILVVSMGLAADQVLKPIAETGVTWARIAYRLIPNFQFFWMVDALNENRSIPMDYVGQVTGYAVAYAVAILLIGMAAFQTREVG